jgi:hypothetical protein
MGEHAAFADRATRDWPASQRNADQYLAQHGWASSVVGHMLQQLIPQRMSIDLAVGPNILCLLFLLISLTPRPSLGIESFRVLLSR